MFKPNTDCPITVLNLSFHRDAASVIIAGRFKAWNPSFWSATSRQNGGVA